MSPELIGGIGILALVALILLRLSIATAMLLVGLIGYAALNGWRMSFLVFGQFPYEIMRYDLSVLPLFVLMGSVCLRAGMSSEIFSASTAIFAGRRGSEAFAAVGACTLFGTVSGSSLATAATMGRVTVPNMLEHGYDPRLAAGAVASSSTLSVLIPPSVILVVYAMIAEQSIAELYAAALIPGLLLAGLHLLVVMFWAGLRPGAAPIGARQPRAQRIRAVLGIWKMALLFGLAIGGIYLGWFSPTEAAAIGAFAAILIGIGFRTLSLRGLLQACFETVRTSATLFYLVLSAILFSYFIVQTRLPVAFIDAIHWLDPAGWQVILLLIGFYLIAGCFLDSMGMLLLTVPVFLPLVMSLGYDPVWFGILVVIVAEVGLITPPVGMNCFVLRQQVPTLSARTVFGGVTPFLLTDLALLLLITFVPGIVTWLPSLTS